MSSENKIQLVRGMKDILPEDMGFFLTIEEAIRYRCIQSGFKNIDTPVIEYQELFERGIGGDVDTVSKEMYRFQVGKNNLALRPEMTVGICRSYIEHGMASLPQPIRLYSIGPCFRHDRPQKGRYRQFHQANFEIMGSRDASIDAQIIYMAYKILTDLELEDRFVLNINTIGTPECRKQYEEELKDYFLPKKRNLSFDSQGKIESNPLRILDSKDEDDIILSKMAPKLKDYISEDSKDYFNLLLSYLDELEINYKVNDNLVRGLDYYHDTVFEFLDEDCLSVCGGGRYDLVKILNNQEVPSMGMAFGMERLIMHLKDSGFLPKKRDKIDVYVACIGDTAKGKAMKILSELHDCGVHAFGAIGQSSMRSQLRNASKFSAKWTLIIGEVEVRENAIILRDMDEGRQERVKLDDVIEKILSLIDKKDLDKWSLY